MEPSSFEPFAEDPVGRYVSGERYAHFCAAPALWGLVLWGRPDAADLSAIWRSVPLEFRPPAVPHAALIDASRLEGSDPASFARVERFLGKFAPALRDSILRLAIVRPGGLPGALVVGAHSLLPFPFPVSLFEDVPSALKWIAPGPELEASVAAALAGIHARSAGTPPFLATLRHHLEARPDHGSLAECARVVAMSERSLQRRLAEAGTTLQEETARARVRIAQRMLTEGDTPLSEIAMVVGCASLQHFSALFKRVTGTTPGAYRKQVAAK